MSGSDNLERVDTSLAVFEELDLGFDEEQPCELPGHAGGPSENHNDKNAEYYVRMQMDHCGHISPLFAVCSRVRGTLVEGCLITCGICKWGSDYTMTVDERIKK